MAASRFVDEQLSIANVIDNWLKNGVKTGLMGRKKMLILKKAGFLKGNLFSEWTVEIKEATENHGGENFHARRIDGLDARITTDDTYFFTMAIDGQFLILDFWAVNFH